MSEQMKKDYLYQELKNRIVSGTYAANTKLPKEFELAEQYGVARGTLRMALQQLENEQLIERVKGQGTYVRKKAPESRDVITYLLPCPDYMTKNGSFAFRHRMAMEGVMKRCQELNCRMETIAVSPTNSLNDIDWRQLEHLDSESRVIISAGWFFPLFDFLKKRRCKVFCGCNHNIRLSDPFEPIPPERHPSRDWFWHTDDAAYSYELAVGKLWGKGCRSIAVASNWLDQPKGIPLQGYRDGLRAYGLKRDLRWELTPKLPPWPYLKEGLVKWYKKEKFDGLLLCPRPEDVPYGEVYSNEILGLPETVKIILVNCVPELSFKYGNLPMVYFDWFDHGYQAVTELMAKPFIPREKIIKPLFSQRNSMMHFVENEQFAIEMS